MAAELVSPLRLDELTEAIRVKMRAEDINLSEAAARIGMSTASLSRILNRKSTPSSDSFALLTKWLGVPAQRFMDQPPADEAHDVPHYAHESTPQIVQAHLRADKNLSAETAKALSEAFNALYQHYSRQSRIRQAGQE